MFFVPACSFKNEIDSNYYCQKLKLTCTKGNKIIYFKTSKGDFEVKLLGKDYPVTVSNFLENINQSLKGKNIGIIKEFDLSDLDTEVQKRFEESKSGFENLGAEFIEVSLPNISASVPTYYSIAPAECSSNLSRFDGVRFGHRAENTDGLNDIYIK